MTKALVLRSPSHIPSHFYKLISVPAIVNFINFLQSDKILVIIILGWIGCNYWRLPGCLAVWSLRVMSKTTKYKEFVTLMAWLHCIHCTPMFSEKSCVEVWMKSATWMYRHGSQGSTTPVTRMKYNHTLPNIWCWTLSFR